MVVSFGLLITQTISILWKGSELSSKNGYCAFDADVDGHITKKDVDQGAFAENGALDQLGKRFFSDLHFNKVSSEDYRKCLNVMANHGDKWVTRAMITQEVGIKKTQINNALVALRARSVLF